LVATPPAILHGAASNILFTYRANQREAESLVREAEAIGRKAAGFRLDTGDVRAFDAFVTEVRKTLQGWGGDRFDYLVNNAGNSLHAGLAQTTEVQFDEIFNVHVKGVYFLTQKLLPSMNDGGRIVNISSGLARIALPGSPRMEPRRERSRFLPATWPKN
jgi:NAD(P)-dependent dehydrogenase (short-subunit alcohol dehydrogenase family)